MKYIFKDCHIDKLKMWISCPYLIKFVIQSHDKTYKNTTKLGASICRKSLPVHDKLIYDHSFPWCRFMFCMLFKTSKYATSWHGLSKHAFSYMRYPALMPVLLTCR
jgi:hypothetical protein